MVIYKVWLTKIYSFNRTRTQVKVIAKYKLRSVRHIQPANDARSVWDPCIFFRHRTSSL